MTAKVNGKYADPTMKLVMIATHTPTAATMESLEGDAAVLIEGNRNCTDVSPDAALTLTPTTSGVCYHLMFDSASEDSTFTLNTAGVAGIVFAAEHLPSLVVGACAEASDDLHHSCADRSCFATTLRRAWGVHFAREFARHRSDAWPLATADGNWPALSAGEFAAHALRTTFHLNEGHVTDMCEIGGDLQSQRDVHYEVKVLGCKERGHKSQGPLVHATGKGWVKDHKGQYYDALHRIIFNFAKEVGSPSAVDRTDYGTASGSARGFVQHHSQQLSRAAVCGDAQNINNAARNMRGLQGSHLNLSQTSA
ncbi:hypothetical protein EMIHUDRAFT_240438 [Emiliania huxleyi CCMP1516]|uniref:Uncharacterized protein n=2 Tax=Emiliania huxleyi TaxID=2903 RepID=A0A0D3JFW8_EMIH1|nr:hypothetical protein EMIHUDRAFT_240438 [Emiliania huxleyi CCMP1516]EOD22403.1 hypothetical protein EMIHUDRAFT_240438 [Emiliania huxleyi CCMP1516]|eukprot:XP_005774832.1 hypothetical protein EMIHUDRAFT_240438 [Emiliania huxleyi CCMP1516]